MKRILTAVIVLPFLIASILVASLWWLFVVLAVAAMVLGLWEFYLLAKKLQLKPDPATGYVAGAALVTISLMNDPASVLLVQFVIIALTIVTLVVATLRGAPFDKRELDALLELGVNGCADLRSHQLAALQPAGE